MGNSIVPWDASYGVVVVVGLLDGPWGDQIKPGPDTTA